MCILQSPDFCHFQRPGKWRVRTKPARQEVWRKTRPLSGCRRGRADSCRRRGPTWWLPLSLVHSFWKDPVYEVGLSQVSKGLGRFDAKPEPMGKSSVIASVKRAGDCLSDVALHRSPLLMGVYCGHGGVTLARPCRCTMKSLKPA